MITNVVDMYRAFLDGIKKDNTAIVGPDLFNRIINNWGQEEWIKENALTIEYNQKQIDDLDILRCATDGEYIDTTQTPNAILYPIAPSLLNNKLFTIPKYDITNGYKTISNRLSNGTTSTQSYPRYLRLLNVMFKINYVGNECGKTGVSEWMSAKILRSDNRVVVLDNPLRKPKDNRLLYEIINGTVRLITGTSSEGYAMRLEYLRYPRDIYFDKSASPTHINCEFGPQQQKEIVDIAIRIYLERVQDPRYSSFLQEEMIRRTGK